ncbi:hypothetical protein BDY21DRAFT_332618 [Lineolata rhizophorae]|uniref:Uncharacterized protein n=1 Tax=Lineolata rhizophorae TaxID=578093 RepID=A0A6A6PCM7_9PEZI|nr:hypothetical protein BDY21DRAFT_332618 [Lineolata rhizophorae]
MAGGESKATPFGQIVVHEHVAIGMTSNKDECQMELANLGIRSEVGVHVKEQPTFADELFRITSAGWRSAF